MSRTHLSNTFVNSQILQVKVLNLQVHALRKMPQASTINASHQTTGLTKNMGDAISRGVVVKSPPLGLDDAPKE